MPVTPELRRLKQEDHGIFEASLGHIVCSKPA